MVSVLYVPARTAERACGCLLTTNVKAGLADGAPQARLNGVRALCALTPTVPLGALARAVPVLAAAAQDEMLAVRRVAVLSQR